jgi:hypothetical protein
MELNFNHLPNDAVHTSMFGGVNAGAMELDVVPHADAVLHHGTSQLC